MWIAKSDLWNNDMTSLDKFLVERIIQRCDYDETISKKHRTINGFTQLRELIKLCELSERRVRTIRTLTVIIKEAKSPNIKQNIRNDIIISEYFKDLKEFIEKYDENKLKEGDLGEIKKLLYQLKKFSNQLEKRYYRNVLEEFGKIDFLENIETERTTKKISDLIDILIPLYLYQGYSINSLNEVLRRWIEKRYRINLTRITTFFDVSEKDYNLLVYLGKGSVIDNLKNIIESDGLGKVECGSKFNDMFFKKRNYIDKDKVVYYNSMKTIDPISFIRNRYNFLLKSITISNEKELFKDTFINFFKNSFFSKNKEKSRFVKVNINGDPISVTSRKSTLFKSLIQDNDIKDFDKNSIIDFIEDENLKKAIYYYKLGIESKSIENSLSLIWTSIECILPYRPFSADIENVRHILSKMFSVGALTRDILYLIKRIKEVNKQNNNCFDSLGISSFSQDINKENIKKWIQWLLDDTSNKLNEFNKISILLGYEYISLIKPMSEGDLQFVLNRMVSSKESIEYQIQRIYLHRNQIIHSGDYINEYTNLWIHLEWYVGKILYFIIRENKIGNKLSVENLFLKIESEFDYIYSYLEKNKKKKIKDSSKILDDLYQFYWQ